MGGRLLVLVVAAAAAVVALPTACSPSCKPKTMSMRIILDGTTPLADVVTIADEQSSPPFVERIAHTPGDDKPFFVEVTWPGGYPANDVVHLSVKALAGSTLLGENEAIVRLDPGCTVAHIYVIGDATPDAGDSD